MFRSISVLVLPLAFALLLLVAFRSNLHLLSFIKGPAAATPPPTTLAKTGKDDSEKIPTSEIERLNLQNDLREEIDALGATNNVSLYYKSLNNNFEVAINPDRSWVPASIVKAFVVVEAFRQRRLGLVNFDSRVTIKQENVVPTELEDVEYQPLRAGVKATIRELVYAMIIQSDNTAYNTLIDVLDRRNITSTLRRLGLDDTVVGEKLSLSDEQYSQDTLVPGRQSNRTTASDFGHLFTLLYEGKIDNSEEILSTFKKQKLKDMIPKLLPTNLELAHKTGFLPPYFHDGGIVYKREDPFVLVVFTNQGNPEIVARLAKICYFKTRDVLGVSASNPYGKALEFLDKIKSLF